MIINGSQTSVQVAVGDTLTASIQGATPNGKVNINLDSTTVNTITADGAGNGSQTSTVPSGAAGTFPLTAQDVTSGGLSNTVSVTIAASPPPPPPPGTVVVQITGMVTGGFPIPSAILTFNVDGVDQPNPLTASPNEIVIGQSYTYSWIVATGHTVYVKLHLENIIGAVDLQSNTVTT